MSKEMNGISGLRAAVETRCTPGCATIMTNTVDKYYIEKHVS
jgi:hypothetical protein